MKSELPLIPVFEFWTVKPKLLLPLTSLAPSGIQPPPPVRPLPLPTITCSEPTSTPLVQYAFVGSILTSTVYGSSDVGTDAVVAAFPLPSARAYTVVCTAPEYFLTVN